MTEIKRKKGETFEAMLRRFSKRMQQSRKILQVKKSRYHEKTLSRNLKRQATLHKLKTRAQKEYLTKTGQLKDEDRKYYKKR